MRIAFAVILLAVIWMIVCQALLSAVVLKTGHLPDICDPVDLPVPYGLFLVVGMFGLAGGVLYALAPAMIILFCIAFAARWRHRRIMARYCTITGCIALGFLAVVLFCGLALDSAILGPAWLRVLVVAAADVVFLVILRRAWQALKTAVSSPEAGVG